MNGCGLREVDYAREHARRADFSREEKFFAAALEVGVVDVTDHKVGDDDDGYRIDEPEIFGVNVQGEEQQRRGGDNAAARRDSQAHEETVDDACVKLNLARRHMPHNAKIIAAALPSVPKLCMQKA